MCLDANAGARAAARQRKKEKDAVFKQKALQFFNKETTFERVMDRNVLGYSRAEADAKSRALKLQGRGRRIKQDAVAKYFRTKKVNEGGRSRKYGKAQYQALLQQEAKIDKLQAAEESKIQQLEAQGEYQAQLQSMQMEQSKQATLLGMDAQSVSGAQQAVTAGKQQMMSGIGTMAMGAMAAYNPTAEAGKKWNPWGQEG